MRWPFSSDPSEVPFKRIDWDGSFAEVFENADDFNLCDRMFLLAKQERGIDVEFDERQADLCVLAVWNASGILDNGGFQYLFEHEWAPMDPHLLNMRQVFEKLGLPEVVKGFNLAFSAFPNSTPPEEAKLRLRQWTAADVRLKKRADEQWFRNNEIKGALAALIRRRKKPLLRRYRFVRKWPENPFEVKLDYSSVEACRRSLEANKGFNAKHFAFNIRLSCEKSVWQAQWEIARENHGDDFGPTHPKYREWEAWYLKNRKRLVKEVGDDLL